MHRELLRLARVLLANSDGSPRWVARSRAVSTSYYALFHALADLCARELVGAGRPWSAFRHIYRSLDHGRARTVLDEARRSSAAADELKRVADFFGELQARRHGADYDPDFPISARDLAKLIDRTEFALADLGRIAAAERKLLAARLIGRARG